MKSSIYLEGKFIETKLKQKVTNPFDQSLVAEVNLATEIEIETAIVHAQKIRKEMAALTISQRHEILIQIANTISENRKYVAELISKESGKPLRYSLAEADRGADTFLIAAEEVLKIKDEEINLERGAASKGKKGIVRNFPIGIVAGITPFNFPLNLVAHKVAPAIACGCPMILKPASTTPLTALFLAEIIDKTILPKGGFQVLPCSRETGDLLVKDERINLLSFTGSPDVGWKMKKDCGKKKIVLELGGNAGTYIHEDADLEFAISRCLVGGFAYSGQICIHAQRIYVHAKLFDVFVEKFVEKTKNLKRGNPLEESTEISEMIDDKNAIRVENWINEAEKSGAKILCGGKRERNFVEATVLTNTHTKMKVNAEEVFGPVVIIEICKNHEEGISMINDSRFGLQAGIFTNDKIVSDFAFENLEVGGVIINDVPTFRVDNLPYGGIKDSGLGREGIKYAMEDYWEKKVLVI
jgi:glyceraldehyde-3-phosphate dehydrogenase (NADP+)